MGKSELATAYEYEATTEPAREASVCELEGALHTPWNVIYTIRVRRNGFFLCASAGRAAVACPSCKPSSPFLEDEKADKYPEFDGTHLSQNQRAVARGTLGEGIRLTEEQLANQLGISKSPVHEALNRLEAEGLVCIESRRGCAQPKFHLDETWHFFAVMSLRMSYLCFNGMAERRGHFMNNSRSGVR
jgi:hypothetical protein